MNATDFFQNQLLTDASSVIDKTRQKFSRNDLIKFAEAYHEFKINKPPKSFSVTFRYTNTTDAALHEEIVTAESSEEALNAVYRNHNYHIEWSTIKELHF